ncbi:16S rRNA (guanine(527)-N(7))-methyltransferase RsmG [Rhodophyticola porphyridii]|uniref:Ribosomal RNA small subunit methyltransferase G n=1 Tax=Rhodophyticola porphyridii TaxID=1852017 RepID=A0A3L9Y339_9RHOB|nr:16S rRNA (guanine(527)-N(7))-methyltransferase RsmG [Rhodophyticola porphyridii]RMA42812.1 16S rRNA (guanine(527)-N(7))-methyltransferase RsmG [Rhodophyticola porphyridii]
MTEAEAQGRLAADVSRETWDRLVTFAEALVKWQKAINLVAPGSLDALWQRHFLDSAQIFPLRQKESGLWLDIGSGGGFPGLVCAILAAEKAPELRFTFIESDLRKCSFLRDVARQTGVRISVLTRRIEDAPPQSAAIISARALAPLGRLCELAAPHLAPDGVCLFQKGANHATELDVARAEWHMKVTEVESQTAAGAVIYKIEELARV